MQQVSLSILLGLLSLVGCAHKPELESPAEKETVKLSKWEDVSLSESLISPATTTVQTASGRSSQLSYSDLMQVGYPSKLKITTETLFNTDYYRRLSFYLGAVGGIYSFIADSQGNVRGRTIGNAVWGIGWTCWLGFGAIVRADIRQIMDEHNEAIGANGLGRASSDGIDPRGNSWAVLWRLRNF